MTDTDIECADVRTLTSIETAIEFEPAPDRYNDARLLNDFDIDDPRYKQEFKWTIGPNKESRNWRYDERTPDVATLIQRLSQHREDKSKDGLAFVTGDMAKGQRLKTAVKALYAIGLDYDKGTPAKTIDDALLRLGCLAIRYTTHSNGKQREQFKRDEIVKWFRDTGQDEDTEIDTDIMRQYLSVKKGWDPSIVKTVKFIGIEHENKGVMVNISHAPMSKNRVVIPLASPFVIADVAPTQQEAISKWAKVAPAMSNLLGLGDALDMTGTDTSRLFYFPRHAKGMPWEITICGGDLFDWKSLELENPYEKIAEEVSGGKNSKSKTKAGKDLGRWSMKRAHGFQIVDVLENECGDKIRGKASSGVDIECPFDGEHSNAGDQDDRACFAVNAGEGSTDWFTISCRHDSCRDYTMLDMLGKMLTDGWFSKDVLESDSYNAALIEDAPQPAVAAKIEKEDKAKATYKDAIAALTPENIGDEIDRVAELIAAAKLSAALEDIAVSDINNAAKKKLTKAAIRTHITAAKGTLYLAEQASKPEANAESHGLAIFAYRGEYNFDDATKMCIRALKQANEKSGLPIFSHVSGDLVRLNQTDKDGRLSFDELSTQALWSELNNRVAFVRKSDQGESARQMVPKEVAAHVWEQGYLDLPPAPEVLYTPVYTREGNLMVSPGYWRDYDMLMADTGFRVNDVPEEPTAEQVEEAVNWLKTEIFGDFPFLDYSISGEEQREPSEANAFAMLLTPFMRRMITSCTPVFFITKPTPGTGGTLLAEVPLILFEGMEPTPLRYTHNEEEMQKLITAAILETRSAMFFDDVREFNNRVLLMSLTAKNIGGRVLGYSRTVARPNNFLWEATGNNTEIGSEMERRCCWIRLNAKTHDIQKRTYRHPNFVQFLLQNRETAVRHILTMIEYWHSVGAPRYTERKRASFEDWSEQVGGVLMVCGIKGFLDNKAAPAQNMDEANTKEFIRSWLDRYKVDTRLTPSELFAWANAAEMDVLAGNNDIQKKARFIKLVHSLDGRVFEIGGAEYIVRWGLDAHDNIAFYIHKNDDQKGDDGTPNA